uniref:ZP domain-containing protein n=1 Tax=Plectus sambesii TaxID=2011161 RepID=A0A914WMB7_9BILA
MTTLFQLLRCALFVVAGLAFTSATPFPNEITGEPAIQCSQGMIHISVNTSNKVPSRIFAKGQYDNKGCFFESTKEGSFNFDSCNMNRRREINPRGMAYTLTIIVQLHPLFVTKVDRAYHVRCFYMEADKAVSIDLGVSDMATETLESGHAMPQCMYGLHTDGPNGPMVRFARVGDKLWHVWDCPSDVFGMLVHSCFVLDGQGNKVLIVDENGCGVDEFVMMTPQYSSDLTRAQQETHVFKFADRISVGFNCQIRLCFVNGDACKGVTPPNCNGRRPSTIDSQQGTNGSAANGGGENSSLIIPNSSNNNTATIETSTLTNENVITGEPSPTNSSEASISSTTNGLDEDLTSDELITTTVAQGATTEAILTSTDSLSTNAGSQISTTTSGILVEENNATTEADGFTDLNELLGAEISTTIQPTDNDTFPTPLDFKSFERKSNQENETLTTTTETPKPPSALERLEEKAEIEGSGEETTTTPRPTDDPASLTIDPALIADANLLEARGRRNVLRPRLHDQPVATRQDNIVDFDINSELTVLERDDAPASAFTGDRRAAAQQQNYPPGEVVERPNVCISALGFAMLISAALLSVIICATAILIGTVRTRKRTKITELIRSVDVRPVSF